MERLNAELQRLYGLSATGKTPEKPGRALVLVFNHPADWPHVAALCQALQDDLGLPPPAVSVDGQGFRLWLGLETPLAAADQAAFLALLRTRYLHDLPEPRWHLASDEPLPVPPQQLGDSERWSAFIDPGMGALFAEDAWLDLPPGADRQADLLVPLRPATASEVARLQREFSDRNSAPPAVVAVDPEKMLKITGPFDDPRDFLQAVMNDSSIELGHRIAAATALLANPASEN